LLRPLGFLLLTTAAVCGWHFARVMVRFGDPLVGNWNAVIGYAWWQDPGYHTSGDLVRFGRALTAPLYSAFHSVPDGLYSTLWGDGLLGGSGLLLHRPPWNYGLMAAGYALAVLPAAALALGAALTVGRLIRRPRAEDLLLAGLAAGTGWAIVYMCLRVPSYAQAKGFYGLLALVPLCALAGRGLELLAGEPRGRREAPPVERRGWPRKPALHIRSTAIAVLLGVWACDAFATYWMRTADRGFAAGAALALDLDGLLARADAAAAPQERAAVLRQLVARDPDHPFAWLLLGDTLARAADPRGAETAWREQLRVDPFSAAAHLRLGRTLELEGRPAEAQAHLALAARLGRARRE
jgi:tetratricopeptide (TPR) repeat protein